MLRMMDKVKTTHSKVDDVEDDCRDDGPVVNVGEDEGVGGQTEDDVPQVEGEVAEHYVQEQLRCGHGMV